MQANSTATFDITEALGFLLGVSFHSLAARLQQNFKKHSMEITGEQWRVLQVLSCTNCINQQEMANKLFKEKPVITRLVDNLEEMQFVERVFDAKDRRNKILRITPKGEQARQKGIPIVMNTLTEALSGFSPEEEEQLKKMLKRLIINLKGEHISPLQLKLS
jgi:DNA-binding MarR family transcriptional regulator